MQQIAFQHPPLRHLNIIRETWILCCLQHEFSPPTKEPLEANVLRNLRSYEAVVSGCSWVDLVTDS